MHAQRRGLLWEVLRLVASDVPEEEFLAKAKEAQNEMRDRFYELWREVNVLDNLVIRVVPHADWTAGVASDEREVRSPATSATPPTSIFIPAQSRTDRVLEIAQAEIAKGATSVTSKKIADVLISQGANSSPRDLAVSAGNILARNPGWIRVRSGEYVQA